jgi:hypothetical protein
MTPRSMDSLKIGLPTNIKYMIRVSQAIQPFIILKFNNPLN